LASFLSYHILPYKKRYLNKDKYKDYESKGGIMGLLFINIFYFFSKNSIYGLDKSSPYKRI